METSRTAEPVAFSSRPPAPEGGSSLGFGPPDFCIEWNAENQLIRVCKDVTPCDSDGVALASFKYDPLGRRVEKVAGGVTYSYVYDGVDILRETVNDGATTSTYRYIHGPGIDEPLARENVAAPSEVRYYHADGLGSIAKMTDQAGSVVRTYQYDAWGNIEVGETQGGYAFTGREWDPEIGLYYYRARYYDPRVGRFISEDPIGFDGGANFYTYVAANPVKYIDPFGLVTILITTYDAGMGSHSAMYVKTPGEPPWLYDPAGSYRNATRGTGGLFEDGEANLADYIQYHKDLGSDVEMTPIPTTAEQERAMKQRAEGIGDPRGFSCASAVSGTFDGACDIPGSAFPGRLKKQAERANCESK